MNKKDLLSKTITTVLLLAIGAVIGYLVAKKQFGASGYQLSYSGQPQHFQNVDFDLFWKAWRLLEDDYFEPNDLNIKQMVDGAISGMVASLGDPYTAYLAAETNKINEEDLAGAFAGVGIELGYKEKTLAVIAPIADSPADKLGVQAGDFIMHVVDEAKGIDEDSYNWSTVKAQQILRGEKGKPVTLSLLREDYNNNLPFDVTIVRDEIVIKSVELAFIEREGKTFAHLNLQRFGERTHEEWQAAIDQIVARQDELAGVILDLRNNPGGLFNGSIEFASEFIDSGLIVTQKGRFNEQKYTATGNGRLTKMPVVVLVNGGTASASEIMAGALRDNLHTPLVGEQTFGKGLVQERVELNNGAGLNITIARWMMPGGDWIGEEGIAPDVVVEDDAETDTDEQLEAAVSQFK